MSHPAIKTHTAISSAIAFAFITLRIQLFNMYMPVSDVGQRRSCLWLVAACMWMIGSLTVVTVQPVSGAALVFVAISLFKIWQDLKTAHVPQEAVFYV